MYLQETVHRNQIIVLWFNRLQDWRMLYFYTNDFHMGFNTKAKAKGSDCTSRSNVKLLTIVCIRDLVNNRLSFKTVFLGLSCKMQIDVLR